jgi:hypothetical protein
MSTRSYSPSPTGQSGEVASSSLKDTRDCTSGGCSARMELPLMQTWGRARGESSTRLRYSMSGRAPILDRVYSKPACLMQPERHSGRANSIMVDSGCTYSEAEPISGRLLFRAASYVGLHCSPPEARG